MTCDAGHPPQGRDWLHLADFGVAMYRGFGRQPGQDGMETMRGHRQAALAAR